MIGLILIHLAGPVNADEWIINDSYIGGTYTSGYDQLGGDVISTRNQIKNYSVEAMTVNINDNGNVRITINTGYSAAGRDGTFDGTKYGDLFISTDGWNPFGDPSDNYRTDNHSNGTSWEYVFDTSAEKIYNTSKGKILLSDDPTFTNRSNWVDGTNVPGQLYNGSSSPTDTERYSWYRHGQEIWFDNTDAAESGAGIFSDDNSGIGGYLTYLFDLSSLGITSPEQGYKLGLHWAMTCGNDVIEGGLSKAAAVPEPGTLVLIGLGILGIGIFRQKKPY